MLDEENYGANTPTPSEYQTTSVGRFSRRMFNSRAIAYAAGLTGLLTSLTARRSYGTNISSSSVSASAPVEYIVIGSGAGGGSLACNLAKAGHKVVLFEAGGKHAPASTGPALFAFAATEDPQIRWDFYVNHFSNTTLASRDTKYYPQQGGVWYPRTGALGGCTLHSANIYMYPSNSDWNDIAHIVGDSSWNADNMRNYFERYEQNRYVPLVPGNPSRHGYNGWLTTELADLTPFINDPQVQRWAIETARTVNPSNPQAIVNALFSGKLDPNDWQAVSGNRGGIYNIPLYTKNGMRRSTRDLILETQAMLPNNLILMTDTLVTRVLFSGTTAIGVEYVQGARLYRADPNASQSPLGPKQTMTVTREVIVAGGAFNSPQILKLSGIGPADELNKFRIPVVVNLPGVGKNLQDRYEIGVVTQVKNNFTVGQNCTGTLQPTTDPCYAQLLQNKGYYTGISTFMGQFRRSKTAISRGRQDPDLVILSATGPFRGYYHGFSIPIATVPNQNTSVILKAHSKNRAGTVTLRSADPRDTPVINFYYFNEGSDPTGEDLSALADGVELVRGINSRLGDIIDKEVVPGPSVQSRQDILKYASSEAWGHHASCSNKMGARSDPMAVVDSNFRVHGTRNLRIVDASVFPKIPGYFLLTSIYTIAEKATDAILADAH